MDSHALVFPAILGLTTPRGLHMTTVQLESASQLIPGAFERTISVCAPDMLLTTGSEFGATADASRAATPPMVAVIAAPRQPETWFGKAGAVLGDVIIAVLIVTMVPLTLIVVVEAVVWLVRAVVAAGGA